jgi:hypothetical protein
MEQQKREKAIVRGDDISPSQFNFTKEEIQHFYNTLEKIKAYSNKEINQENFQALCDLWYLIIDRIPFAPIPIDSKWVLRARPNFNKEIFEDESDISYNTKNTEKITLNRFNRPEETVFYTTLPSDEQTKFIAGASLECCKDLINEKNETLIQYLTFGKWHLKETFLVLNLCFEEKALSKHLGLKRSVDGYLQGFEKDFPEKSYSIIKYCWSFLSQLASTRHTQNQQYFITTAFFCTLREYYKIHFNDTINGIIYPSSMVHSESINLVLMPKAVDKYLYLKEAFMYKYVREADNKKSYVCGVCSLVSQVDNHRLNITGIKLGSKLY